MNVVPVLHYSARTDDDSEGAPAGVVLHAAHLTVDEMQSIAAQLGYAETAFVVDRNNATARARVRYFSAAAELPLGLRTTVATAVALGADGAPATMDLYSQDAHVRTTTSFSRGAPATTVISARNDTPVTGTASRLAPTLQRSSHASISTPSY